jgi:ABC-2 type transport system ATP-binding protein
LAIRKREVFAILGHNGAGKTTSIKMMAGLLRPTSGRVFLDGVETVSKRKERIGICPQEIILWNALTCTENLAFMGKTYRVPACDLRERIDKLLTFLSLSDQADRMASKLSGGMRRRFNIALALVHNLEIVFLDEPSVGLDPLSPRSILAFLANPSLIFWGLFGSFFSRKTDAVVVARAPLNANPVRRR